MSDPVPAHIELIQSNDILRKVVANVVIDSKLPLNRILRGQQVGDLNIQPVSTILTDEINLLAARLADGDSIAPAQQLHVNNVFQNQVDVLPVAAEHSFPYAVVGHVIFLGSFLRLLNNNSGYDILELSFIPGGYNDAGITHIA